MNAQSNVRATVASTTLTSSNASTLHQASHEWATRPNDERHLNLLDLQTKVRADRAASKSAVVSTRSIEVQPNASDEMGGLQIVGKAGVAFTPSHWSFGQLSQLAGAPAGYLRTLPAPIAADALNYGLKFNRDVEDVGLLLRQRKSPLIIGDDATPGVVERSLVAATGPKYGRVWNHEVADALVEKFGNGIDGHFRVPGEFGRRVPVTKANTTIYSGDRDMFVFLADEENRIVMDNRRNGQSGSLARGFFVWNSEVGSSTFGIAMFLFDYVCMNRIVWGVQGHKELRIRHTTSAPDRWLESVVPAIQDYSSASAKPIEDTLKAAQAAKIEDLQDFLTKRRFSKSTIRKVEETFEAEESRKIETLWDVTTGITAYAKTIGFQDERVAMEREGGKLLDLVEVF